ncbi:MAG TPA: hypothetical protein VII44_12105, partial [Puia sp.]
MKFLQSISLLLIIFLALNVHFVFSQSSRFSTGNYGNNSGDTLSYRLLFPDADTLRKYPLVIFLHGSGERGSDNEAQLKWGV